MTAEELLDELIELADRMGIGIRRVPMAGAGGSLANLRGTETLFLDTQADPEEQLERLIADFARLPCLQDHYIIPELRTLLDSQEK